MSSRFTEALVFDFDGTEIVLKKNDLVEIELIDGTEYTGRIIELETGFITLDISAQYYSSFKNIKCTNVVSCEVIEPEDDTEPATGDNENTENITENNTENE